QDIAYATRVAERLGRSDKAKRGAITVHPRIAQRGVPADRARCEDAMSRIRGFQANSRYYFFHQAKASNESAYCGNAPSPGNFFPPADSGKLLRAQGSAPTATAKHP